MGVSHGGCIGGDGSTLFGPSYEHYLCGQWVRLAFVRGRCAVLDAESGERHLCPVPPAYRPLPRRRDVTALELTARAIDALERLERPLAGLLALAIEHRRERLAAARSRK